MDFQYIEKKIEDFPFSEEKVYHWLKKIIQDHKKEMGDISLVFCSDDYILDVNKKYLNHDYYTDIITFDYVEGDVISGDLIISLDTVKSNSEKFKTSCEEELSRVMAHGILHLLGYGDKTKKEQVEMRKMEDDCLESCDL